MWVFPTKGTKTLTSILKFAVQAGSDDKSAFPNRWEALVPRLGRCLSTQIRRASQEQVDNHLPIREDAWMRQWARTMNRRWTRMNADKRRIRAGFLRIAHGIPRSLRVGTRLADGRRASGGTCATQVTTALERSLSTTRKRAKIRTDLVGWAGEAQPTAKALGNVGCASLTHP